MLALTALAHSQAKGYPYLLRVAHETSNRYSCALLQSTGAFHLEIDDGAKTKVLEGSVSPRGMEEIEQILRDKTLTSLSQAQIGEPLISSETDRLQISMVRNDRWQHVIFESIESQRPFQASLKPLVRWMNNLHKFPHKTLTEDAGKNNCQPPKQIALTRRSSEDARSAGGAQRRWPALLRMSLFSRKAQGAQEKCILITPEGKYRFEDRSQAAEGKPVSTAIFTGNVSAEQIQALRRLLDAPSLANTKHREPPGGMIPVLGDLLTLTIPRATGEQKIVLSSGFGRQFGAFYGGDGPLTDAAELTKFLKEDVEEDKAATRLAPSARNGCEQP